MGRVIEALKANRRDARNQRILNRMRRKIRRRIRQEARRPMDPYQVRLVVLGGLFTFWVIFFAAFA